MVIDAISRRELKLLGTSGDAQIPFGTVSRDVDPPCDRSTVPTV